MRFIKDVKVEGRDVKVYEMTVKDVRKWMMDLQALAAKENPEKDIDVIASLLYEEVDLSDITRMTDLTMDDIDGLHLGDIDKVLAICKQVNPRFFALKKTLIEKSQEALESSLLKQRVAG